MEGEGQLKNNNNNKEENNNNNKKKENEVCKRMCIKQRDSVLIFDI